MSEAKAHRQYWKEIGLVILGAVLASIPTLTSTYMHGKTQIQQLVLDRQLLALKDFSICHNKVATEVMPAIEKLIRAIDGYEILYRQKHLKTRVLPVGEEINGLRMSVHSWMAEYNSQRVVINA